MGRARVGARVRVMKLGSGLGSSFHRRPPARAATTRRPPRRRACRWQPSAGQRQSYGSGASPGAGGRGGGSLSHTGIQAWKVGRSGCMPGRRAARVAGLESGERAVELEHASTRLHLRGASKRGERQQVLVLARAGAEPRVEAAAHLPRRVATSCTVSPPRTRGRGGTRRRGVGGAAGRGCCAPWSHRRRVPRAGGIR